MSGYVCECCGEETNLFGKGGGEVMAREFGERFLGGMPVDGQWGVLVEEGRRPRYGGAVEKDDREEDEDDDDVQSSQAQDGDGLQGERDEGLLVDKYRSCSLRAAFGEISRQLIEIVETRQPSGR